MIIAENIDEHRNMPCIVVANVPKNRIRALRAWCGRYSILVDYDPVKRAAYFPVMTVGPTKTREIVSKLLDIVK
jgi:hypothetical protein